MYHHLRVLLQEGSEGGFRLRLQQFLSWLSEDESLSPFLDYFQKQYVKRLEQWAPCFRGSTPVNINMALEAFHRVLKVCYMEKKQNCRLDHLHLLLKINRDKVFDRIQNTQIGNLSHALVK